MILRWKNLKWMSPGDLVLFLCSTKGMLECLYIWSESSWHFYILFSSNSDVGHHHTVSEVLGYPELDFPKKLQQRDKEKHVILEFKLDKEGSGVMRGVLGKGKGGSSINCISIVFEKFILWFYFLFIYFLSAEIIPGPHTC